jgi:hypothetical protein
MELGARSPVREGGGVVAMVWLIVIVGVRLIAISLTGARVITSAVTSPALGVCRGAARRAIFATACVMLCA